METRVNFDKFLQSIAKYHSKNLSAFKKSFALLFEIEENEGKVTLEIFGKVLSYFGPFNHEWADSILSVLEKNYFWGTLSTCQAEEVLSNAENGTFLLRFSSQVGNWTLSFVSGSTPSPHFSFSKLSSLFFILEKAKLFGTQE